MTVNPINTGQGNAPAQVTGAQSQSGDEAFQRGLTKSDGFTKEELQQAVSERTRLTRTRKAGVTRRKNSSLFAVEEDDDILGGEPVYRTVMVDGIMHTLRLIAVA